VKNRVKRGYGHGVITDDNRVSAYNYYRLNVAGYLDNWSAASAEAQIVSGDVTL